MSSRILGVRRAQELTDLGAAAERSARVKELFERNPMIRCPYFNADVVLNGEGLYHLRYSVERERSKPEQMLKFRLV